MWRHYLHRCTSCPCWRVWLRRIWCTAHLEGCNPSFCVEPCPPEVTNFVSSKVILQCRVFRPFLRCRHLKHVFGTLLLAPLPKNKCTTINLYKSVPCVDPSSCLFILGIISKDYQHFISWSCEIIIVKRFQTKSYQVMFDFFGVVRRSAIDGGADPDRRPGRLVDSNVRILAQVDVSAMVTLFANHLKIIQYNRSINLKWNKAWF